MAGAHPLKTLALLFAVVRELVTLHRAFPAGVGMPDLGYDSRTWGMIVETLPVW